MFLWLSLCSNHTCWNSHWWKSSMVLVQNYFYATETNMQERVFSRTSTQPSVHLSVCPSICQCPFCPYSRMMKVYIPNECLWLSLLRSFRIHFHFPATMSMYFVCKEQGSLQAPVGFRPTWCIIVLWVELMYWYYLTQ